MEKTLKDIAQELRNIDKKVQLIYAFNGVGKTRLSREFKQLISSAKNEPAEKEDTAENALKVLYYNAFTEDLFYWDNDLENDIDRKIKIQPNSFTYWILHDEGQEDEIAKLFSHYTGSKLTPEFRNNYSEVSFYIPTGDDSVRENIKISNSENSNFIWCVFYAMLELVIEALNTSAENRSTDSFNHLEYIFIDDPVTSLDENHLVELAVDLAQLIKESKSSLKFIITTHNPLFYNVLCNEFKKQKRWRLVKFEDGTYDLIPQDNDAPFAYHISLLSELKQAIDSGTLKKYHFAFLRNILEKTAIFLGYANWKDVLDDNNKAVLGRLIDISSHSHYSGMEVLSLTEENKSAIKSLFDSIVKQFNFKLPNNMQDGA